MRNGIGTYILLIVLVLLLFGVISLGDVLSVFFYIVIGIVALVLLALLAFRIYIGRMRRRMEEGGQAGRAYTYSWGSPRQRGEKKKDGDITVQHTESEHSKTVRNEVGDYVEFEEVEETVVSEENGKE